MNNTNENIEFIPNKEIQNPKSTKRNGILIYQEAKTKLQISKSGNIYKQKVLSYIPIIGPLFSTIYANLCIGKTRCLRSEDSKKFKSAGRNVNLFAFLVWPIIFLGLWTLFQYLFMDFAWGGAEGAYVAMWNQAIDVWKNTLIAIQGGTNAQGVVVPANNIYIGMFIGQLFQHLFGILINPLEVATTTIFNNGIPPSLIVHGIPLKDTDPLAILPNNILFIASILVLTWINPVNIVNSLVINTRKLKFTVVLDDASAHQYNK